MRFNIYFNDTSGVSTSIGLRMGAEQDGKVPSVAEILVYFVLGVCSGRGGRAGWEVPSVAEVRVYFFLGACSGRLDRSQRRVEDGPGSVRVDSRRGCGL